MNKNLRLVVNNSSKNFEEKYFFEKDELKIILNLYAQMVAQGYCKDYGLSIGPMGISFDIYKRSSEKPRCSPNPLSIKTSNPLDKYFFTISGVIEILFSISLFSDKEPIIIKTEVYFCLALYLGFFLFMI